MHILIDLIFYNTLLMFIDGYNVVVYIMKNWLESLPKISRYNDIFKQNFFHDSKFVLHKPPLVWSTQNFLRDMQDMLHIASKSSR